MKRSELNDKIKTGLTIDEDSIIVINGKTKTVVPLSGAEFNLETGKVLLTYIMPVKQRTPKQTVNSKGGKK